MRSKCALCGAFPESHYALLLILFIAGSEYRRVESGRASLCSGVAVIVANSTDFLLNGKMVNGCRRRWHRDACSSPNTIPQNLLNSSVFFRVRFGSRELQRMNAARCRKTFSKCKFAEMFSVEFSPAIVPGRRQSSFAFPAVITDRH